MLYRAVVLDMDGTMMNESNHISETLSRYLMELRQRGIYVFIATGRTPLEMRDVWPEGLEVDGVVISNGMAAYIGEEQLIQHALDPELVTELVEKARQRKIYYEIHPHEGNRTALACDQPYFTDILTEPKPASVEINEWLSRGEAMSKRISWQEALSTDKVTKIYYFSEDQKAIADWRAELEAIKANRPFATFSSSDHNVEIMVANVSKATGIKYLLDRYQLQPEEIIAVGDSENDLPMFQFAGHAVAMKNASERVKQQAKEVTEYSYREDGLYRHLKKVFG